MKAVRFTVPKFKFRRLLFTGAVDGDGNPTGPVFGFEDDDAADYFVARKAAAHTADAPDVIFTKDEIDIDPATVWANGTPAEIGIAGQRVLGGGAG